jgi:hypothetical protein
MLLWNMIYTVLSYLNITSTGTTNCHFAIALVLFLQHVATWHCRRLDLGEDAPWSVTVADLFGIT